MASSPGHVGRPNEDFVGAVPGAVVLLDGAGIPGTDSICRHGVAWYAHILGATLLGRLSREPGAGLVAALADSIGQVAGHHRHTCDIADPSSPQSTVAIIRFEEDRADLLVLADAFVVLDSSESGPQVVTDSREVSVRSECSSVLDGLPPRHARVRAGQALGDRRPTGTAESTRWVLDRQGRSTRGHAGGHRQCSPGTAERRRPPEQRGQSGRGSLPPGGVANRPPPDAHDGA